MGLRIGIEPGSGLFIFKTEDNRWRCTEEQALDMANKAKDRARLSKHVNIEGQSFEGQTITFKGDREVAMAFYRTIISSIQLIPTAKAMKPLDAKTMQLIADGQTTVTEEMLEAKDD